jgi:hypothetical protein
MRHSDYVPTGIQVRADGKSAGSIFYLCQTEKCDVHNRVTRYQPTMQEKAKRKKKALAERIEKQSRVRILDAIWRVVESGRDLCTSQLDARVRRALGALQNHRSAGCQSRSSVECARGVPPYQP